MLPANAETEFNPNKVSPDILNAWLNKNDRMARIDLPCRLMLTPFQCVAQMAAPCCNSGMRRGATGPMRLTHGVYTDLRLLDLRAGVNRIQDVPIDDTDTRGLLRKTGTDDASGLCAALALDP